MTSSPCWSALPDGVFVGWAMLSGVYKSGHGEMTAYVRWRNDFGVYDAGRSMQRRFAQSGADYAITSYGMRFHPVLGKRKKHNGVDYGARSGKAGRSLVGASNTPLGRASGKLIIVSHANGYETICAHLSKIHVRKGQYVAQQQLIEYVETPGRGVTLLWDEAPDAASTKSTVSRGARRGRRPAARFCESCR